ncbi:hypothetical protein BASA82_000120 [Batrachochytrium salamandrivorans]|nr:hypothetical protein BASA82_000120 [Batrachochytrium salamandrivorans]
MRNPLLNSTVDGEEGGVGTFDLEGLTCSSCVNTVRNSLAGFSNVRVALFPTPHLKVDLLEESGAQQVVDLVESMGFGCLLRSYQPNHSEQQLGNGQWKQVTLRFPQAAPEVAPFGMRILKRLPGFVVELEYDTRVFPGKRSALAEFAEYGSVVLMEEPEGAQAKFLEQKRQKELGMWKVRTLVALACALPVMVLSMMELGQDWLVFALSTVVMFYSGWPFHYEAVTTRRFNMSLLVSLGSSCAYFFSLGVFAWDLMAEHELELEDAFETSAVLIAFVVLGKYLECSAKHKTSEAVAHLATLQPSHAILVGQNHRGRERD